MQKKLQNIIQFIAQGFGSGLSPVMPGTCGTIIAIPIYLLLHFLPFALYLLVCLAFALFGVWACSVAVKAIGEHDHPSIVWDEISGFLVTMIAIPFSWYSILLGFILFRTFDIWKPWPISILDEKVTGGLGVMLDDWIAAVYGWLVLIFLLWLF